MSCAAPCLASAQGGAEAGGERGLARNMGVSSANIRLRIMASRVVVARAAKTVIGVGNGTAALTGLATRS